MKVNFFSKRNHWFLVLGMRKLSDSIDTRHVSTLKCTLIGVQLLEDRGMESLVVMFLRV